MTNKILIEVELGLKGVEKRDIFVFVNDKLQASYFNASFDDIHKIADEYQQQFPDAKVEISCKGEDCCGKLHRWKLNV